MGAPLDAQEHESVCARVCVCVCVCVCVFACVWPLPELQAVAQNHYEAVCVCVFACVCQKRCFKYALALDELVGGLQSLSCM